MSFTKIASAGIGSTELVTLHSLNVLNNANIDGVLTYEDVTNVDSVGLITARNGIVVGSGITLSKDGDGFFTGVTTATTFVGALTGNVSGGTVAGSTGTFSSAVSATKGTFSDSSDIDMSNSAGGQLVLGGNGYTGAIALNATGMNIYHNSASRSIVFGINETEQVHIDSSGIDVTGTAIADALNVTGTSVVATLKSTNNNYVLQMQGNDATDKVYLGTDSSNNFVLANTSSVTERLRITSAGAFGFNTSTVTIRENIHTHQTDSNQNYLRFTNTGTGSGASDGFNVGITAAEEAIVWNFENTDTLFATNNTERLRITSDGKVGINDNDPDLTLHVKDGDLSGRSAANTNCDVLIEGTDNTGIQFYSGTQTQLRFGDAASTAAGAIIYQHSDDQFKFNFNSGGFVSFNSSSVQRLHISNNGGIGIGNDDPTTWGTGIPTIEFKGTSSSHTSRAGTIAFESQSGSNGYNAIYSDAGNLYFYAGATNRASAASNEALRIASDGHTLFGSGANLNGISGNSQIIGFMGAKTTTGTTDWNDATNARSGNGYTLLLGTATNGMGGTVYFHSFTFEYASRNGTGNMTQIAIPYSTNTYYTRYRYNGTWSSWVAIN